MKTGIFILTNKNRIDKLKTTLYFLLRNVVESFKTNINIMTIGKLSNSIKDDILYSVRESCRYLIDFIELESKLFELPKNIDENILNRSLQSNITQDWGTKDERLINRFWIIEFWKIVKDYDYIMKIDDDLFIEEPIKEDFFKIMDEKGYLLLFNILQADCPIATFGLKDFLSLFYQNKQDEIQMYFNTIRMNDMKTTENFKNLYKMVMQKDFIKQDIDLFQPIVCHDAFYITKPSFWLSEAIQTNLANLDKLGYVFYFKWSPASILSLLVMVNDKSKVSRCIFKMSNTYHREYIKGHSLPDNYKKSGCISNNQ